MVSLITIVLPYYENAGMLPIQLAAWQEASDAFSYLIVDDGSPDFPALDNLSTDLADALGDRLAVYRVQVDIPWNQHGARNLGAQQATSPWLFMCDMDNVVPPETARQMLALPLDDATGKTTYYKFPTRISATKTKGPPFNIFMCTREAYWETGGYDEDYSGTYGGDGPFLRALGKRRELVVPEDVFVTSYSRAKVPQASTTRYDREHYRELCRLRYLDKVERKDLVPCNPIRFPWSRVR